MSNIQKPQIKTEHHDSVYDAIMCHLPYAVFSVALSLLCLSLIMYSQDAGPVTSRHAHRLFHTLHLMHILFAGTGVVLTFRKYSQSLWKTFAIGLVVPAVFCTLSDAIMPYFGGCLLNLDMKLHWCFISHTSTVMTFLLAGIFNGIILSAHSASRYIYYSLGSHFVHIFISALASTFYFVSFGLEKWWHHLGFLFGFLVLAVVVPCTLADLVVPMLCGKMSAHNAPKNTSSDGCCGEDTHAKHTD
jgi:hypothetical protein